MVEFLRAAIEKMLIDFIVRRLFTQIIYADFLGLFKIFLWETI